MSPVSVSSPNNSNIMSRKFVREKRLMDNITLLSDGNYNQRINAANDVVKLLIIKQNEIDEVSKELEYCLTRLIRGLASSKSHARLGFSLALIKILKHFEFLKVSLIHEVANKVLTFQKTDSKADKSNVKIGIVMVHIALIQSGKLASKSTPSCAIFTSIEILTKYKHDKKPLHLICTQALCILISQVSMERYRESIADSLDNQLKECADNADSAMLLMLIVENHPKVADAAFMKKYWNNDFLISNNNLSFIAKLYINSTVDHPVIHPFCDMMMKVALTQNIKMFTNFWRIVISEGLFEETLFRKYLGIRLICTALKATNNVEQIKVILSQESLTYIRHILTNRRHGLHTSILEFVNVLQTLTSDLTLNPDIKLHIITCILSIPRTSSLEKNKTNLFSSLVNKLDPVTTVKLSELFIECFYNNTSDTEESEGETHSLYNLPRDWLAQQLSFMVSSHTANESMTQWRNDILKFFFVNSYFRVKSLNSSTLHCSKAFIGTDDIRNMMNLNLMKSLCKLATIHTDKQHSKDHNDFITTLKSLFNYAQELFNKKKICELLTPFDEETKTEWNNIIKVLENINNKKTIATDHHAFQLLFLHLGLHLFSTRSAEGIDLLKDLNSCYTKAFSTKKNTAKSEEPDWVSVLTELLVSMLSENNKLCRVIVNTAFRMLCPHIDSNAMQLIIDVLGDTSDKEDDAEDQIDFDSDGDDADDDADNNAQVVEENSGSDEDDDEMKDKEEEEEEEEEISTDESSDDEIDDSKLSEIKNKIKDSLGEAIQDSDEEEELSDLSDGDMERFDKALAAVFKARKKESRDTKDRMEQLKCFHLKILDLIAIYVNHHPDTAILLQILKPLLLLTQESKKNKATEEISKKALNVLQQLTKPRKLIHNANNATEDLLEFLKELLHSVQLVSKPNFVTEISSICIFIIRVLQGIDEPSVKNVHKTRSNVQDKNKQILDNVVKLFQSSIIDFCSKRDSKMDHRLFIITLQRIPILFWPITEQLLKLTCDSDIRLFCRTQVCNMLSVMVTKFSVDSINKWEQQSQSIVTEIVKSFKEFEGANFKPRLIHNMLSLFSRTVMTVSIDHLKVLMTPEVVTSIEMIKTNAKVLKDTKSVCTRLKSYLNSRIELPEVEIKEKTKKAKKDKLIIDGVVMNEEQLRLNKSKKRKESNAKSEESKDDVVMQDDENSEDDENKKEPNANEAKKNKKIKNKKTKRGKKQDEVKDADVIMQDADNLTEDCETEPIEDDVNNEKSKSKKDKKKKNKKTNSDISPEKSKKNKSKRKSIVKSEQSNLMDTTS